MSYDITVIDHDTGTLVIKSDYSTPIEEADVDEELRKIKLAVVGYIEAKKRNG